MMTGNTAPWPLWKLGLLLYPFVAGAVAINLFMLGLIAPSLGLPSLTPMQPLWLSLPLGLPVAWAAALWVRHLLAEASR
jgi:hypothetical protein